MRIIYKKQSLWSKILNNMFVLTNCKKNSSSEEAAKKFINKVSKKNYMPKILKKFNKVIKKGITFYTFNGSLQEKEKNLLLYVHGGNFVERANRFQISFAMKIAKQTNSILIFPQYELLPSGNYKKMYELLNVVYNEILNSNPKKVVFLGDRKSVV